MQLANDADIVTACPIDRDDGFDSYLVLVSDVDHSGVDRSCRAFSTIEIGHLCREVPLNERHHPVQKGRKAQVLNARF